MIGGLAILLLMLLVMWLGQTRGDSHRVICERRQQQTAAAIMQFEALQGNYPGYKNLQAVDADGEPQPTGWAFTLLPFLESQVGEEVVQQLEATTPDELRARAEDATLARPYEKLFTDHGPTGADRTRGTSPKSRIMELICPDDPTLAAGEAGENAMSWVVNTGLPDAKDFVELPADWTANGIFENQFDPGAAQPPLASVPWLLEHDGLSATLLLTENMDAGTWPESAENLVGFVWVVEVIDGQATRGQRLLGINEEIGAGDGSVRFARPSSYHVGGVNAVYASGKTQFLSQQIDWLVFTQLMTSDGADAKLPGTEEPVPDAYR